MGGSALRETTVEALRKEGLTVLSADNGMKAAGLACESRPGVVVASALLPFMDGIRLCRFLKTHPGTAGIPVVLFIPDGNRNLRFRAELAGADTVLPYSHPTDSLARKISTLMASSPFIGTLTHPDNDQILHSLSESLLEQLERLETVAGLAEGLRTSVTVQELFRRIAVSVLVGLGFERVWGGGMHPDGSRFEVHVAMGTGISRKPVELRHPDTPAAIAVKERRQVHSASLDAPPGMIEWSGTLDYLDTPIIAGGEVLGLIRTDRGATGRSFTQWAADGVRILADMAGGSLLGMMAQERVARCLDESAELLDALESAVVCVDSEGLITEARGNTGALLGREPHQLVGLSFKTAVILRGVDQEDLAASAFAGTPESASGVIADNANERVLEVRYLPGRARGRSIESIKIMFSDMTREYQLGLELQDRTQELETISGISRELQAVSDIDSVCSTLLRTLQRLYPRECLSILLAGSLDEGAVPEVMVVKAERGYREEWSPVGQVLKMTPGGRGAVLRAVYSARPVNIRDTGQTIDYVANQEGTASELVVPMISQGRIVGVIDLQSPVAYRYESDDVRRIQKIAEQAAGAVEGALMQDELFDMARRDRLTGLHNLRYFEEKYAEEFDRASRYGYPFSLIVLDIDDFKVYNDAYGHPMGNLLLKRLTVAVRNALREVDIPVRYGGEEFVCILPLTDIRVAEEVAERIRQRVLEANPDIPHSESQPGGSVSVSLGVASFPVDSRERDELFEIADQRMYSAKRAGKNRVCAR